NAWTGIPPGGTRHAFLFRGGAIHDLGTLSPAGIGASYAFSVNNGGQVAGAVRDQACLHAVRWTDGVIEDLGTLPGRACIYDLARNINELGDVTGLSGYFSPNGAAGPDTHGFLYR